MSHFQKYILNSTTSVLNQVLDQTEKFLFSYFLHRTDIKLKYLLRDIVKRNIFNKILFFSSICKILRYKFNSRKITRLSEVNWMPLIKAVLRSLLQHAHQVIAPIIKLQLIIKLIVPESQKNMFYV